MASWFKGVSQKLATRGGLKVIIWALALIQVGQCVNYWNQDGEIKDRDGHIEELAARVDSAESVVVVAEERADTAEAAEERANARADSTMLAHTEHVPTVIYRTITVGEPGQGGVTTPETVAIVTIDSVPYPVPVPVGQSLERCVAAANDCQAARDSADISEAADSVVIHEKTVLIGFQAAQIDTMEVQIEALRRRGDHSPFTVVLGPGVFYDMTSCEAVVVANDPETGASAVATQDCPTFRWGIGVTGGLDLVWTVNTIGRAFSIFGL